MVSDAHVKCTVHVAVVDFLPFLSSFFGSFISANPPDLMVGGQAQELDDLKQKVKIQTLDIHLILKLFAIASLKSQTWGIYLYLS